MTIGGPSFDPAAPAITPPAARLLPEGLVNLSDAAACFNAFASQVHVLDCDPSDDQLAALMLSTAEFGWPIGSSTPADTTEEVGAVAEFVITETLRRGRRIESRTDKCGRALYRRLAETCVTSGRCQSVKLSTAAGRSTERGGAPWTS